MARHAYLAPLLVRLGYAKRPSQFLKFIFHLHERALHVEAVPIGARKQTLGFGDALLVAISF